MVTKIFKSLHQLFIFQFELTDFNSFSATLLLTLFHRVKSITSLKLFPKFLLSISKDLAVVLKSSFTSFIYASSYPHIPSKFIKRSHLAVDLLFDSSS